MRINTNVSALNTQRVLGQTGAAVARSIGRLSSGFRINRAGDDAAGLGIANKLHADTRAMKQAARNAEQASSVLQIMEGASSKIQGILERMKELAAQSGSDSVDGTASSGGRKQINDEFVALRSELDRIVSTTKFQGSTLLNGSFGTVKSLNEAGAADLTEAGAAAAGIQAVEVGSGAVAGAYTVSVSTTDVGTYEGTLTITNDTTGEAQTLGFDNSTTQTLDFDSLGIKIKLSNTATDTLLNTHITTNALNDIVVASSATGGKFLVSASGAYTGNDLIQLSTVDLQSTTIGSAGTKLSAVNLGTSTDAQAALTVIDDAISNVADALGTIGAAQNRIDYAAQNVKTAVENFAAAESTIRDADMAEEMSEFTRSQILQQAGVAMLAQANAAPQLVLRLLG